MKSFPSVFLFFMGSLLLTSQIIWSQSPIFVKSNDFVTTTFFFPSNIEKVVAPGANFQFTYEEGSNIGLLKGHKGKASNLLVITEKGYVYSFALSFAEEVEEFNFILTIDQAITRNEPKTKVGGQNSKAPKTGDKDSEASVDKNQNQDSESGNASSEGTTANSENDGNSKPELNVKLPNSVDTLAKQKTAKPKSPPNEGGKTNKDEDDLYDVDREEYYRIFCENNYLQKTAILRTFRQDKKIVLRLNNILVDRSEKFFVLQIENNSRKEFAVEGISFFRKSDVGQLEKIMTPLFTFNLQETIDPDSINEVVLVFESFNISNKEELIVVLAEKGYDKMVRLPLRNNIVNFPSN